MQEGITLYCTTLSISYSLYILERGLVSIGKLTYQTICICSSAHGWNVQVRLYVRQGESWE